MIRCENCNGDGVYQDLSASVKCQKCNGRGFMPPSVWWDFIVKRGGDDYDNSEKTENDAHDFCNEMEEREYRCGFYKACEILFHGHENLKELSMMKIDNQKEWIDKAKILAKKMMRDTYLSWLSP